MNPIAQKIRLPDWARTRRLCGFDDRVALSGSPRCFVVSADVLMLIILLHAILMGINISGILGHSLWLQEPCILLSVTTGTPIIRFSTPLPVTHEDLLWPTSL
jgi:hypothetical protein